MAKKLLLPLGRALVASTALILAPGDAALDADLVPDTVAEETRSPERRSPSLPSIVVVTQARAAWLQRDRILPIEGYFGRARDFLALAREHDHEAYQVEEAATSLRLTRQHLHRQCLEWFGFPPGVIIDLPRMSSVYGAIRSSYHSLASIAAIHGFLDLSKMGRFTLRFTGLRPLAIRETRPLAMGSGPRR